MPHQPTVITATQGRHSQAAHEAAGMPAAGDGQAVTQSVFRHGQRPHWPSAIKENVGVSDRPVAALQTLSAMDNECDARERVLPGRMPAHCRAPLPMDQLRESFDGRPQGADDHAQPCFQPLISNSSVTSSPG